MKFLIVIVLGVILAIAWAAAGSASEPKETQFLDLMNAYRVQNGVPPVHRTATLDNATDWHANDMAANHYVSHNDSLGRDPFQRMCAFGYCYNAWKGEDYGVGYPTAAELLAALQSSPGHNAILLDARYTVVGIGQVFVEGSDYGTYWSLDFASVDPDPTPTPAVTPKASKTPKPTPKCMVWWRCRR